MIMTVRTFSPALGKQAELRAVLTEWVRTRQSDGADSSLTQRIYNGESPAFNIASRFADLAALDHGRKRTESSDAFPRFQERLNGLVAAPASVRIYNILVPPRATGDRSAPVGAGGIVASWYLTPAAGRSGDLQRLLREHIGQLQSTGQPCSLRNRILNDSGAEELVITHTYPDLAGHQAFREYWLPTDEARAFFQAVRPLLASHDVMRLSEVLVPFPAR